MTVMKRQMIRLILAVLLVTLTTAAAKLWIQKYNRDPDPKARFVIMKARVSSDRSYRWLELHLRKNGDANHDLSIPVRLIEGNGTAHEPADITFAGSQETGFSDIWFKFWLDPSALDAPLMLRINEGLLVVKSDKAMPALNQKGEAVFKSENWSKSWLGF